MKRIYFITALCLLPLLGLANIQASSQKMGSQYTYTTVNDDQELIKAITPDSNGKCAANPYVIIDGSINLSALSTSYPIRLCPNLIMAGKGPYSLIKFNDNSLPQGELLFEVNRNDTIEDMTIKVPADHNVVVIGNDPSDTKEQLGHLMVKNVDSENGLFKFSLEGIKQGVLHASFVNNTINIGSQCTGNDVVAGIEVTAINNQMAHIDRLQGNSITSIGPQEPGIFMRALGGGKVIFPGDSNISFNTIRTNGTNSYGIYDFTSGGKIMINGGINNNLIYTEGAQQAGIKNKVDGENSKIMIGQGISRNNIITLGGYDAPGVYNQADGSGKITVTGEITGNDIETSEYTDPSSTTNSNFVNFVAGNASKIDLSQSNITGNVFSENVQYYYSPDDPGKLEPNANGNPEFSNSVDSGGTINIGKGNADSDTVYLEKNNSFILPRNATSDFVRVSNTGDGVIK